MIGTATLRQLVACGLDAAQILAVAEAMDMDSRPKDATAAERQQRHRDKLKAERDGVTRDVTRDDPSPQSPPLKAPPDPQKITPPLTPHPSTRASRLPEDFQVPASWIEWAMAKRGWSRAVAEDEAECFCRYWQAKSGREATKLDWEKTWQNWAVNSRRQDGTKQYDRDRITV